MWGERCYFEQLVLSRAFQQHLHWGSCDTLLFGSGLDAHAEFDMAHVHGGHHYARGVQIDGALYLLASPFSLLRRITSSCSCWARGSALGKAWIENV